MKIHLNETHISILGQVIPDLHTHGSPLSGSPEEVLLVLVITEWHKKHLAKLTYSQGGFKASFTDAQAYAIAKMIQCTMLPEEYDSIELSILLDEIAKKLPKSAFKKISSCPIYSLQPHSS